MQALANELAQIKGKLGTLSGELSSVEGGLRTAAAQSAAGQADPFVIGLLVFVLACFIGYYVVWKVTPALHSPLMAVTNAISSVIIVGAIIAAGQMESNLSSTFGFIAVVLASVNIFGGFIVTQRMLSMFSAKKKKTKE